MEGIEYDGEWTDDCQNGYGIETWNDGSKYKGNYKFGKKEGYGEYYWSDGSIYKGNWINNKPNGNSTYVTKGFKENISYQDGTIIGSVIPEI